MDTSFSAIGETQVADMLSVSKFARCDSTVSVNQNTILQNQLSVVGNIYLSAGLSTVGDVSLGTTLTVRSAATVCSNFSVFDNVMLSSVVSVRRDGCLGAISTDNWACGTLWRSKRFWLP